MMEASEEPFTPPGSAASRVTTPPRQGRQGSSGEKSHSGHSGARVESAEGASTYNPTAPRSIRRVIIDVGADEEIDPRDVGGFYQDVRMELNATGHNLVGVMHPLQIARASAHRSESLYSIILFVVIDGIFVSIK